jgi:LacI family transcriptional regulator
MGHITELGHRNIAHIAGPQNTSTGHARYCGFLKAMEHHGLTVEKKFIAFSDSYSIEEGRKGALAILSLAKRPTAIVCANDLLALGCYDVLRDLKLKCPQDVSVTGFNDMPFVDRFEPPMTTVHVPTFKMGELAAKLLLEAINTPKLVRRSEMVKPTLVVRKSTGKPKSR